MKNSTDRSVLGRGFTLVELLVVIVIIAILLGILLPALASVRQRARKTEVIAQLNSLAQSSQGYSTDFQAFPGYFSEIDINNSSGGGKDLAFGGKLSSNENLVLSLLGQVVTTGNPSPGYTITSSAKVDLDKVGAGPRLVSGRIKDAYYSPRPGELKKVTGGRSGSDNDMKELIGVQSGMPILYYRAVSSGKRPTSVRLAPQDSGAGYFGWVGNVSYVNGPSLTSDGGETKIDQESLSLLSSRYSGSDTGTAANNLAWCVISESLSNIGSGNSAANGTDDVIAGQMAFIAAGQDKVYLKGESSATITQRSTVTEADDIIIVAGQ